jgi:hypothetical protein
MKGKRYTIIRYKINDVWTEIKIEGETEFVEWKYKTEKLKELTGGSK